MKAAITQIYVKQESWRREEAWKGKKMNWGSMRDLKHAGKGWEEKFAHYSRCMS